MEYEDDLTTTDDDDIDDIDWDNPQRLHQTATTRGRDPTRPSFDTSSLTAPPAPINHLPHHHPLSHLHPTHMNHHPINSPTTPRTYILTDDDDRPSRRLQNANDHFQNTMLSSSSSPSSSSSSSLHQHGRHRWSDVIDPGVAPPHPSLRSPFSLRNSANNSNNSNNNILPPPLLLPRRWSETETSCSSNSNVEGYSLAASGSHNSAGAGATSDGNGSGNDSSSTKSSGVIAIGIPESFLPTKLPPTTTTTTTMAPRSNNGGGGGLMAVMMDRRIPNSSIHSNKTATSSTSTSSHRHRHQKEAAAAIIALAPHHADEEEDDALGRLPWRRHDSNQRMMMVVGDNDIDTDIDTDDIVDMDDLLEHDIVDDIQQEEFDERLARHLAARELQDEDATNNINSRKTSKIPMTTPIKTKINLQQQHQQQQHATTNGNGNLSSSSLSTDQNIQSPNHHHHHPSPRSYWWKWSPGPRSLLWTKKTNTWSSSSSSSTTTLTTPTSPTPAATKTLSNSRGMLDPKEEDATAKTMTSTIYPTMLSMMTMMADDDMMVDLDSCPSGMRTMTMNDPAKATATTSSSSTMGLRRIGDYDANSEQPPPPPPPRHTDKLPLTTGLRATSSSSSASASSSSSPWSFVRWQQKLQASIQPTPERFKTEHDGTNSGNIHDDNSNKRHTVPGSTTSAATQKKQPPSLENEKGPRLATPFMVAKASPPALFFAQRRDPYNQQQAKSTSEVFVTDTDAVNSSKMAMSEKGPQLAMAVGERRPSLFSPIIVRRGQRNNTSSTSNIHTSNNITSNNSSHHRQLQLAATMSLDRGEEGKDDDDDDDDEVEAQAGIPILLPGAFAVDGIDTLTRRRSRNDPQNDGTDDDDDDDDIEEDNLLDDVSEERRLARQRSEQEEAVAASAVPPLVTVNPIQAELHPDDDEDLVLAQAAVIVTAVDEEQEQAIQSKQKQRLRTMKWVLVGLALVALITIIIVVVVIRSTNDSSNASTGIIQTGPIGWSLVGSKYSLVGPGDEDNENFGWSFATNYNASKIIVGIPGWDLGSPSNPMQVGQVQVYQEKHAPHANVTWNLAGTPWLGVKANERLGRAVAMSADGSIVAVASEFQVVIYSLEHNSTVAAPVWKLVADFSPNSTEPGVAMATLSSFGDQQTNMAMSEDGSFLVVGIPNAGGSHEGLVRAYAQIGFDTWSQVGQDILGNSTGALFGTAVDISLGHGGANGASVPRIAAGGPGFGQSSGQVETFVLQSNVWTLEQSFTGGSGGTSGSANAVGQSVALSQDGIHLAIGASGASTSTGISLGQVQIYQLLTTGGYSATWVPLGNPLLGSSILEQFGYSVALSSSGDVVAVGAPQAQDPSSGNQVGRVQVFQLNGGVGSVINSASAASSATWSQVGGDIFGINLGEDFGYTVALSANGKRVLGGAPFAPYDGGVRSSAGAIRAYDSTL